MDKRHRALKKLAKAKGINYSTSGRGRAGHGRFIFPDGSHMTAPSSPRDYENAVKWLGQKIDERLKEMDR